jgi:hypothetical protein
LGTWPDLLCRAGAAGRRACGGRPLGERRRATAAGEVARWDRRPRGQPFEPRLHSGPHQNWKRRSRPRVPQGARDGRFRRGTNYVAGTFHGTRRRPPVAHATGHRRPRGPAPAGNPRRGGPMGQIPCRRASSVRQVAAARPFLLFEKVTLAVGVVAKIAEIKKVTAVPAWCRLFQPPSRPCRASYPCFLV